MKNNKTQELKDFELAILNDNPIVKEGIKELIEENAIRVDYIITEDTIKLNFTLDIGVEFCKNDLNLKHSKILEEIILLNK
jgi:hypothetical protein